MRIRLLAPTACSIAALVASASGCSTGPTSDGPTVTATTVASTTVASTTVASTTVAPTTVAPTTVAPTTVAPTSTEYPVVTLEGSITDQDRGRLVPYLLYAPVGLSGPVPLILVSHGGTGNERGHLAAPHLGSTFAAGGFVAVHLAHLPSKDVGGQLADRPADVTFLLDQFEAGAITLPAEFVGTIDLTRVGHTGHSYGAYTSHAVGGATYARTYRDERIDAIAPISPQGPDQFGAFDNGPSDSTWSTVIIPVYNLIGGDEIDTNAVDTIDRPGWRLVPFERYPAASDTFRTLIDGQRHADMWREGSADVEEFIATEILEFMQVYVGGVAIDPCGIGVGTIDFASIERQPASNGSILLAC